MKILPLKEAYTKIYSDKCGGGCGDGDRDVISTVFGQYRRNMNIGYDSLENQGNISWLTGDSRPNTVDLNVYSSNDKKALAIAAMNFSLPFGRFGTRPFNITFASRFDDVLAVGNYVWTSAGASLSKDRITLTYERKKIFAAVKLDTNETVESAIEKLAHQVQLDMLRTGTSFTHNIAENVRPSMARLAAFALTAKAVQRYRSADF